MSQVQKRRNSAPDTAEKSSATAVEVIDATKALQEAEKALRKEKEAKARKEQEAERRRRENCHCCGCW